MRNRVLTITTFCLAAVVLVAALPALAEEKAAETAVYAVPNLAADAVMKDLVGALAPLKGIVSAEADSTGAKLLVTFSPDQTGPDALTAAITRVAPESKFEGVHVAGAKADASACGKCPSKATCGAKK